MQFKDLTFWGIFKLLVIFEVAVPIVISPFIFAYYLIRPEKFSFNFDWSFKTLGITVKTTPDAINFIGILLLAIVFAVISIILQSAILHFLGRKTLLGKIRIGT